MSINAEIKSPSSPDTQAEVKPPGMGWPFWRAACQLGIVVALLSAWQFLPKIDWLSSRFRILDPFYVSSPTEVWASLQNLISGDPSTGVTMWPYLRTTVTATLEGTIIGLALGALAGLIFSNSERLSQVSRPFIVLANSVPRVAIIPISVVIVGPTTTASVINVVAVVFFIGFFNSFEGGRSIKPAVLENAQLLGASNYHLMRSIRLPMVLTWTFAAVPNAISFGLIVAVTTELLAGVPGMGVLLQTATANIQTSTTFAIIVVLSIVGLVLYWMALFVQRAVLAWQQP